MSHTNSTVQRIEMKFQLDASLSEQIKDWARDHLGVDENCKSDSGDSYVINTLYLDTPELDLFHRTGVIGAAKHRIRRYGNEQTLWVETKRKKKLVVRKNRTAVFESDWMAIMADRTRGRGGSVESDVDRSGWCADWFMDRITERRLQPAIQIGYRRFARTSTLGGENLRLTIDSHMVARPTDHWKVSADFREGSASIADCEILELKFHDRMPHLFKELLRTFTIPATGFSKYRTAMTHRGCPPRNLSATAPTTPARPSYSLEEAMNV